MKYLILVLFAFNSFISAAQEEDNDVHKNLVFTPIKIAIGKRYGSYTSWNKQLQQYGYRKLNQNDEVSFEFSLYLKNHLVIKTLMSVNSDDDSTFHDDKMLEYKRRMYGLNIGYNIFSINKISKWIIVPSIGIYGGNDKLTCTSRSKINSFNYDISEETLYRYESGINPNLYISIDPFSDWSFISFFGIGIDIGAFYNMNMLHTNQYSNSLNERQIKNDKQFTPYLKISFEPFRGIFYYEKKDKMKLKQLSI